MSPKTVGWGLILIGLIGFAQLAHCQSPGDRLYRTSVAVAIGAQGADIASSWGGIESNPVLGRGQRYGWQATGIKLGVVTGCLIAQRWAIRRNPKAKVPAALVNFGMAGATAGVAARNWRTK